MEEGRIPNNPLSFIVSCVREKRVFWTYHINMRLEERSISTGIVGRSVECYEIIEEYPEDKYLPSYLIRTEYEGDVFHILIATDVAGDNVRIVTAYRPDPEKWESDGRRRRQK